MARSNRSKLLISISFYVMLLNDLLKLILVSWLDHKVVKPALYGYVVVLLRVVSRATAVNRLLFAMLACINHGTQLFDKLYAIEIRHTIVD